MELTDKEYNCIQDMLQTYRDLQEEVYEYPEDSDSLFTETQRQLFTRFHVVSVNKFRHEWPYKRR